MRNTIQSDVRIRAVRWRDLLELTLTQKLWELSLSAPWLICSVVCYHWGYLWLGAVCSFYFFLTGLRQSHGAQHYSIGLSRVSQDIVMLFLSTLMLCSMHAVQVSHMHHHRHCLDDDDAEGSTARLRWWQAILIGPVFLFRLHRTAWRLGSPAQRNWMIAEFLGLSLVVLVAATVPVLHSLRWHFTAMLVGESLTGFFAVWTVHHDCDSTSLLARTQRGRWVNRLCYSMFYHAEHHLFPLVPTCHISRLAARLDTATPDLAWKQVIGAPLNTPATPNHALPRAGAAVTAPASGPRLSPTTQRSRQPGPTFELPSGRLRQFYRARTP